MSDYEEKKLMKGAEKHIRVSWWDKLPIKGKKVPQSVETDNWWDEYEMSDKMIDQVSRMSSLGADEKAKLLTVEYYVRTGWDKKTLEHYGYISRRTP